MRFSLPLNLNELGKLARFDVRIYGVAQTNVATEGCMDGRSMRLAPIPRHGTPSHPKHSWTRSFRSMMGKRRARLGLQG